MKTRSVPFGAVFVSLGALACAAADGDTPSAADATEEAALTAVENVEQYADCRSNGHDGTMSLDHLSDPWTKATFETANCIVGRLTDYSVDNPRPYSLQTFKQTEYAQWGRRSQTFFFKRISRGGSGEPPSECLKIKLTVKIGATDEFVTINRVKQLPPRGPGALCSDNGES